MAGWRKKLIKNHKKNETISRWQWELELNLGLYGFNFFWKLSSRTRDLDRRFRLNIIWRRIPDLRSERLSVYVHHLIAWFCIDLCTVRVPCSGTQIAPIKSHEDKHQLTNDLKNWKTCSTIILQLPFAALKCSYEQVYVCLWCVPISKLLISIRYQYILFWFFILPSLSVRFFAFHTHTLWGVTQK